MAGSVLSSRRELSDEEFRGGRVRSAEPRINLGSVTRSVEGEINTDDEGQTQVGRKPAAACGMTTRPAKELRHTHSVTRAQGTGILRDFPVVSGVFLGKVVDGQETQNIPTNAEGHVLHN